MLTFLHFISLILQRLTSMSYMNIFINYYTFLILTKVFYAINIMNKIYFKTINKLEFCIEKCITVMNTNIRYSINLFKSLIFETRNLF